MKALAGVALLAACAGSQHVTIAAPPADLAAEQRVELYQQLRAAGERAEATHTCGAHHCTKHTQHVLVLANGTEVRHAEDLAPVLATDSDAGRAVERLRRAKHRSRQWAWTGWSGLVAGSAVALVGVAIDNTALEWTGLGLGGVVGGAGVIGVLINDDRARSENARVFATYDASLAQRLDVCVDGLGVAACAR